MAVHSILTHDERTHVIAKLWTEDYLCWVNGAKWNEEGLRDLGRRYTHAIEGWNDLMAVKAQSLWNLEALEKVVEK